MIFQFNTGNMRLVKIAGKRESVMCISLYKLMTERFDYKCFLLLFTGMLGRTV